MQRARMAEQVLDWSWFLVLGAVSTLWCITAAGQLSATYDEPFYITQGLQCWHTGTHQNLLRMGTMPLPIDLETLPLYLWERWQGIRFDPQRDMDQLLPLARGITLLFWWLLLIYARLAGRHLAGPWGGRLAVALLAFEPSVLAHAGLATTDIAVSACVLALVYHFRTGRDAGWFRRLALPSFWFGAALLAKASSLVFGPLCLLAVEWERLLRTGAGSFRDRCGRRACWRPCRRDLKVILPAGLMLAFLYCGCDWQVEPSFVKWAHELPESSAKPGLVWVAENLRIFRNAGSGLGKQVGHNLRGHEVFLLGEYRARSVWYYFPVLLTVKLSLPLLLAPLLIAAIRPRAFWNWACMAAGVLLLFSLACRVQIGIRLLLPLVVLAAIGLGAALAQAMRESGPGWRQRLLTTATGTGLLWTATAALLVWPMGLCYVNELYGGTATGYQYVGDSNFDWGQGLKELARWQDQHQLAEMDVWYFGTDPLLKKLPMRDLRFEDRPIKQPAEVEALVRDRVLAVSPHYLKWSPGSPEGYQIAATYLRDFQPVARTTTFFIYDFTREDGQGPSIKTPTYLDRDDRPEEHYPSEQAAPRLFIKRPPAR